MALCRVIILGILIVFCATLVEAGWRSENLIKDAEIALLGGNYTKAIGSCEECLKLNEGKAQRDKAHYILGIALLKSESYTAARENFGKVLSDYPKSKFADNALLGIADSYYIEGDLKEAKYWYEVLDKEHPKSSFLAGAYLKLGKINEKLGNKGEAEVFFAKIRERYPDSFEARQIQGAGSRGIGLQGAGVLGIKTEATGSVPGTAVSPAAIFCVQIGLFKDRDNAYKLKKELCDLGYDTEINIVDGLYKVGVGKFLTESEAEEMRKRLARRGFCGVVRPW